MTWKYSTDGMNGTYTINWSPSIYGTPYVNSVEKIVIGNFSFQDITFVYSSGYWNGSSLKQNMKKKQIKKYNIKDLEYDPQTMYTHIFDPMATESNAKLKKELKEKDDLIAELNEQIQEMKEEIELLKAINQEC